MVGGCPVVVSLAGAMTATSVPFVGSLVERETEPVGDACCAPVASTFTEPALPTPHPAETPTATVTAISVLRAWPDRMRTMVCAATL